MRWPPVKAWTKFDPYLGHRYFVAINYGGNDVSRWVNFVSVLDGSVRLIKKWNEINDQSHWIEGWNDFCDANSLNTSLSNTNTTNDTDYPFKCCLHPSLDSGLYISNEYIDNRPWFN